MGTVRSPTSKNVFGRLGSSQASLTRNFCVYTLLIEPLNFCVNSSESWCIFVAARSIAFSGEPSPFIRTVTVGRENNGCSMSYPAQSTVLSDNSASCRRWLNVCPSPSTSIFKYPFDFLRTLTLIPSLFLLSRCRNRLLTAFFQRCRIRRISKFSPIERGYLHIWSSKP